MAENSEQQDSTSPQASFRVVDFEYLPPDLNSEEKFKAAVEVLCEGEKLPPIFPRVLNYKNAKGYGKNYFERLTALPQRLLDSDTFLNHLDLKEPIEDILLFTNTQRTENGFSALEPTGDGWSPYFMEKMNLTKPDSENLEKPPLKSLFFSDEPEFIHPSERKRLFPPALQAKHEERYPPPDGPGHFRGQIQSHKSFNDELVIRGKVRPAKPQP